MIKNSVKILVLLLVIFLSAQIIYAQNKDGGGFSTGGQIFGGQIIKTKATEIESLENSNYKCIVAGQTIQIKPIKGPSSYFISAGTESKTGNMTKDGQLIIGQYSGKTAITCIYQGYPPTEQIVNLDTVIIFGNSKQ